MSQDQLVDKGAAKLTRFDCPYSSTSSSSSSENEETEDCNNYDLDYLYEQLKEKTEHESLKNHLSNVMHNKDVTVCNSPPDISTAKPSNSSEMTGVCEINFNPETCPNFVQDFECSQSTGLSFNDACPTDNELLDALDLLEAENKLEDSHIKVEPDITNVFQPPLPPPQVNPPLPDIEAVFAGINENQKVFPSSNSTCLNSITTDFLNTTAIKKEDLHNNESFQMPQSSEHSSILEDSSSGSWSTDSSESELEDGKGEFVDNVKPKPKELETKRQKVSKKKPARVNGEIIHSDLPPIEDLHITVPEQECVPLGNVQSFVDDLVVVKALPYTPALDINSVLFLEKGNRPLGHIFDVIGPVKSPFYCVRFNSFQHIKDSKLNVGMDVYCAPRTKHTSYIFVEQLRRIKGSDASWKDDIEPDSDNIEYSDDDAEKTVNRVRKQTVTANKDDSGTSENHCKSPKPRRRQIKSVKRGGRVYRPAKPVQQSRNAFYRNTKRFNPKDNGRIGWDPIYSAYEMGATGQKGEHVRANSQYDSRHSNERPARNSIQNTADTSYNNPVLPMVDFSLPPPPLTNVPHTPAGCISPVLEQTSYISRLPVNYRKQDKSCSTTPVAKRQEGHEFGQIKFNVNLYPHTNIMNGQYPPTTTAYNHSNSEYYNTPCNPSYTNNYTQYHESQYQVMASQTNVFHPPLPPPQINPPLPPPPPQLYPPLPPPRISKWIPVNRISNDVNLMPPGT